MKLDCRNPADKVIGRHMDIFLNGEKITDQGVFEASEEEGYVVVANAERRPNGVLHFTPEVGNPHGCRTRLLRGAVELKPMLGHETRVTELLALSEGVSGK